MTFGFVFQFLVPVKTTCSDHDITVNVCIPESEFNGNELHKDMVLQRSESSMYYYWLKTINYM
jgi:hypothetical protein